MAVRPCIALCSLETCANCFAEARADHQAKAVEVRALADAKLGKDIGDARKDAADDRRDADYRVALEKCDAFAGDAKSTCVESAKSRYGKG